MPPLDRVLRFTRDDALGGFEPDWVVELEDKLGGLKAVKASKLHAEVAKIEAEIRELKDAAAAKSEPTARHRLSTSLPGIGHLVRDELVRFRYLGPLRELHPDVAYIGRRTSSRGGWADGSAAWGILDTRISGSAEVVGLVSDWLSREDRLDTGYELRMVRIVHLPAEDIVREKADDVAALLKRIADAPVHSEVQIVETRTGLRVRTSDIGVGISQLLPVVVAVLDPDRPEITAIEQPELHLHPRLQVELGDLFAERAARGGVLLIETHSEHLLLRIMKRMRQTSDGTLPEGAPAVRPEDVNVLFVEQYDEQTLIREMPLNERGELVDAWPGGFFEEDLREIF